MGTNLLSIFKMSGAGSNPPNLFSYVCDNYEKKTILF